MLFKWALHFCRAKGSKNSEIPGLLREWGIKSTDSRRAESVSLLAKHFFLSALGFDTDTSLHYPNAKKLGWDDFNV